MALSLVLAIAASSADGGPLVTVQDARITESSGLVVSRQHPNTVWTVNDSGSIPVVYAVSTRTGKTRAVLRMQGIDVRDTEALALLDDTAGRAWLCVADIGDNRAVRASVVLRLVREPSVVRSGSAPVVSLRLRYPDGPTDAETLIWTADRRLLVVTKALFVARVYEVPPAAVRTALSGRSVTGPVLMRRVASIGQTLATDGTALPDGRLVVRGYESATTYRWEGTKLVAQERLSLPQQPQGETIAVEPSGRSVLVGSEGARQPLWRVPVAAPVQPSPTASRQNSRTPAPSTAPQTTFPQPAQPVATAASPKVVGAGFGRWRLSGLALVLGIAILAVISRGRRPRRKRRR